MSKSFNESGFTIHPNWRPYTDPVPREILTYNGDPSARPVKWIEPPRFCGRRKEAGNG